MSSTENPDVPEQPNDVPDGKIKVKEADTIPATGKRPALRNLRRQLTDDELGQSGTTKMLLEMLEEAESEKASQKTIEDMYHAADKRAAVLEGQLNINKSIEIFFGVGLTVGGTLLGLAPALWKDNTLHSVVCFVFGLVLIVGSCIGRAVKR